MVLSIVCVGISALNAPDRKNAGIRQSRTWAVRYSIRVSVPLVNIWLMSVMLGSFGFQNHIYIILFKYLYNSILLSYCI